MTLSLVLASAAALSMSALEHDRATDAQSDVAAFDVGDVRVLHARLERELVDHGWADTAQRTLDDIYSAIPSLGFVTVRCATTMCEVQGLIAADGRDRAIDSLRAPALAKAVQAAGFDRALATGFRNATDEAERRTSPAILFTTYWSRQTRGTAAPRIIATSPADGATIPSGTMVLSVTFDQPMRRDSASFTAPQGPAAFPECDGLPGLSADRRTYRMQCSVQPNRTYVVGFDTAPISAAETALPAQAATVRFTTR